MVETINQIIVWVDGNMFNLVAAGSVIVLFLLQVYNIGGGNIKA